MFCCVLFFYISWQNIVCTGLATGCIYGAYAVRSNYCKPFFWWLIILICIDIVALVYQLTLYNDICDEITKTVDDYKDCKSASSKAFTFTWGIISILFQIYFVFIVKNFIDIVK